MTDADRERAGEMLKWPTGQGGRIDLSRLPRTKPPAASLLLADDVHVRVERVTAPEETGNVHDVCDPEARFLGTVKLPFPLSRARYPIVRDRMLYGVTQDELEVQIEKP